MALPRPRDLPLSKLFPWLATIVTIIWQHKHYNNKITFTILLLSLQHVKPYFIILSGKCLEDFFLKKLFYNHRADGDLKGILHQKIFYRPNLIFWIVMGCGIARFGRRGLKTTET